MAVGDFIQFADPDGLIGFPIVREGTSGTVADRRRHRSRVARSATTTATCGWVTSSARGSCTSTRAGRLLEAPISLPDGLMSPNNPHLGGATPRNPQQPWDRGDGDDSRTVVR